MKENVYSLESDKDERTNSGTKSGSCETEAASTLARLNLKKPVLFSKLAFLAPAF